MNLRGIWWEVVDCIHLTQDRDHWWALVNTFETSGSIKGGEFSG